MPKKHVELQRLLLLISLCYAFFRKCVAADFNYKQSLRPFLNAERSSNVYIPQINLFFKASVDLTMDLVE